MRARCLAKAPTTIAISASPSPSLPAPPRAAGAAQGVKPAGQHAAGGEHTDERRLAHATGADEQDAARRDAALGEVAELEPLDGVTQWRQLRLGPPQREEAGGGREQRAGARQYGDADTER